VSAILPAEASRRDFSVIGLVGFAHGTSHFFHLMLPPLFPWLMEAFDLRYTEVGALMTLFFVVSGIGQAVAGFWVDRFGAYRVLCWGIGLLATSGALLGMAQGVEGLMLAAAVAGAGNSVFHPADFSLLNRKVNGPRLGHAFSAHALGGYLGWAAGPVLMTAVASVAGWRAAGFAAAAVGATALGLMLATRGLLRDVPAPARVEAAGAAARVSVVRVPEVWFAFAFFLFATLAFGALQNFAPAVLGGIYGLSLGLATAGLTAFLMGGAAGVLLGGFVAKPGSRHERAILLAFGFAALLALLLATAEVPGWSVIPLMALMGIGTGAAGPSRDMMVRRAAVTALGENGFGRMYGLSYSGLDVGLAASPLLFGGLLDAGQPAAVLVGVAASLGLAILVAARVGSPRPAVA